MLFGNEFDSIKYIQKNTGFRPFDLNRQEFHDLKVSGWQMVADIDFRVVLNGKPPKSSPLTLMGELKYLFSLYEGRGNEQMMLHVANSIDIFQKQYKDEIPTYSTILFNLPYGYRVYNESIPEKRSNDEVIKKKIKGHKSLLAKGLKNKSTDSADEIYGLTDFLSGMWALIPNKIEIVILFLIFLTVIFIYA